MQIFIKAEKGVFCIANINETCTVFELKLKIQEMINVNANELKLLYKNNILNDSSTFKYYSIHDNSLITAFRKMNGGVIECINPSAPIGDANVKVESCLLPKGKLSKRFIKITDSTNAYFQRYSDCYVYAACSAYINTAMRIYGLKSIPSFDDCYKIACYEKENGGDEIKAIQLLENKYHLGIQCERRDNVTIQDVLNLSVIVGFSTSKQGWADISKGDLLTFPIGKSDGAHAALVEGYDLDLDCFICKNSWGNITSEPRFNFSPSAAHSYEFTVVYFTEQSILGKTTKEYKPRMRKFIGELNNQRIHCAWMDEITAIYDMDFVAEYHPERKGDLKYLGYKIDEWIEINLNRKKGQKFSDHYIYNSLKKNDLKYLFEIINRNDLLDRIENEAEEPRNLIKIQYLKIHNIPASFPQHEKSNLYRRPHQGGKLTKRFIRNSLVTTPFIHHKKPTYAYTAVCAYIDTIYRIYGVKYIPTFEECYRIAAYSGSSKGSALKAIQLLENHFNFGIQCSVTNDVSPRDSMALSVIAKITTCEEGWKKIKDGKYLERIEGNNETTEYALVKGYDLRLNCFICKNSWDEFDAKPIFNYKCDSIQNSKFIVVYFTFDNIIGKTIKEYEPNIKEFIGQLRLKQIHCAWMDETTAKYETDYVIEYHPEKKGRLKYLGYNIDEWIDIMRAPSQCLII